MKQNSKKNILCLLLSVVLSLFLACDGDQWFVTDTPSADTPSDDTPSEGTSIADFSGKFIEDTVEVTIDDLAFTMIYAQDQESITFPIGESDDSSGTVTTKFFMAQTEVTYELWYKVQIWAKSNSYTFAKRGLEGHDGTAGDAPTDAKQEPVTTINWRDSIVWCNALTEYYNATNGAADDLQCVYYTDSSYTIPLRSATNDETVTGSDAGTQDCPYIYASTGNNTDMASCTADGFRLPTSDEWEYAARYLGKTKPEVGPLEVDVKTDGSNGYYWTPADYVSGATAKADDGSGSTNPSGNFATDVAWYDDSVEGTHEVATKVCNVLGVYDISGNVSEWCFDSNTDAKRMSRGGCYSSTLDNVKISISNYYSPLEASPGFGFRIVKTE